METEKIETLITEVLNKMGIEISGQVEKTEDELGWWFKIRTPDSRLLIGNQGEVLRSLNYLMRHLTGSEREPFFIVDVNGYYEKQVETVKHKARTMAERAKTFQTSVEMEPMNPFQRRCVHSLFTNNHSIVTESVGSGEERRVVIKFQQNSMSSSDSEEF